MYKYLLLGIGILKGRPFAINKELSSGPEEKFLRTMQEAALELAKYAFQAKLAEAKGRWYFVLDNGTTAKVVRTWNDAEKMHQDGERGLRETIPAKGFEKFYE